MIRAVVIVVVHALVQALLVLGDPVPGPDVGFVLRTLASLAVMVLALLLLLPGSRRRVAAVGLVVLAAVAALVSEVLTVVVIAVGAVVLGSPRQQGSVLAATGRQRRHRPVTWEGVGRALAVVVLVVLCRVVALLAGLVLAGPVAALVTWLVAGLVAALVLTSRPPAVP